MKKIFGKEIWEIDVEEYFRKQKLEAEQPEIITTYILNPESFIILPSKQHGSYEYPDILVAMEKSNNRRDWAGSYEALHSEGAFMLTMRQYFDFLQLLKEGVEGKKVYNGKGDFVDSIILEAVSDEILTVRNPQRAEWLDALFEDSNRITYQKITRGGNMQEITEPIEKCLRKSCKIDLSSINSQGLPTREGDDIFYRAPVSGCVARFAVFLREGACLACGSVPKQNGMGIDSSLREVRTAYVRNL